MPAQHPTTPALDGARRAPLDPGATAAALHDDVVVRWWQDTALATVSGPDAPTLLDGLCTQAVERIEPGTARLGLFLDAKAQLVAPAIVHRLADAPFTDPRSGDRTEAAPRIAIETLPDLLPVLLTHIGRFRLRARAALDAEPGLATVALVGAAAHDGAVRAAAITDGDDVSWSRCLDAAVATVALVADPASCRALVADTTLDLADPATVEATRIQLGHAGLHDLLPGRMPAEVGGMRAAVALDAGCYLGQEPVARLHYRGRANRTLRRLEAASTAITPSPGALDLRAPGALPDSRPVGQLTTWAARPDGRVVALAVVRREVDAGDHLELPDDAGSFVVVDPPPPARD